jgi:hypothetical protein
MIVTMEDGRRFLVKFQYDIIESQQDQQKRKTTCLIKSVVPETKSGDWPVVSEGMVKHHKGDPFRKAIGRKYAFEKALGRDLYSRPPLYTGVFNRQERTTFWNTFLDNCSIL